MPGTLERNLVDGRVEASIRIPPFRLAGKLEVPAGASAVVLFAHGSGSSHRSPRNERVAEISAVVSRGGRPDLAGPVLGRVRTPTLLAVGGHDLDVLELNRAALAALTCVKALEVVPGATHLFEEPGALERVTELAAGWFSDHLVAQGVG